MRYRKVDIRLWGDKKFRSLSPVKPSGQSLFIYLLGNPYQNSIPGLYKIGEAALAEDLGWDIKSLRSCCQEIEINNMCFFDFDAKVMFLPNCINYNKPENFNVIKSWKKSWDEIPECDLKSFAYQRVREVISEMEGLFLKVFDETIVNGYGNGSGNGYANRLRNGIGNGMANQEQEHEQQQEQEHKHKIHTIKNFDQFWSIYPRHVGKGKCREIWTNKELNQHSDAIMQDLTQRATLDDQWHGKNTFVPHPATYLNQKRWEDEDKIMLKEPERKRAETYSEKRQRVLDEIKKEMEEEEKNNEGDI